MKRILAALVAALALHPAPAVPADAASQGRTPPRVVQVAYGDVFIADPSAPVVAVFAGRAGQRVVLGSDDYEWDVSCARILLTHRGTPVAQDSNSVWTLRHTGTHRLRVVLDCKVDVTGSDALTNPALRLRTLDVRPGSLREDRLDVGVSRDSIRAVSVKLNTAGPVRLERLPSRTPWDSAFSSRLAVLPERSDADRHETLFNPDCTTQLVKVDQVSCDTTFRKGRRYLIVSTAAVGVSRYPTSRARLNGAAVETARAGAHWIDFAGSEGDLVYLEKTELDLRGDSDDPHVAVRLPDGSRVRALLYDRGFDEEVLWQLPTDGTYSLDVSRLKARGSGRPSIRLRTALGLPMEVGVPLTVPVGGDRWSVALLDRQHTNDTGSYTVSAVAPPGWRVVPITGGERRPELTVEGTSSPYFHPAGVVIVPGQGAAIGAMDVQVDLLDVFED